MLLDMKVLTLEADSPLDAQQDHKQSEAQTSTGWQCHGCVAWFFTLLGALLHPDTAPCWNSHFHLKQYRLLRDCCGIHTSNISVTIIRNLITKSLYL